MFRTTATLLVIFAILSLPLAQPTFAQSQVPAREIGVTEKLPEVIVPDMKRVIAEHNKKYAELSGKTDAKTMEKLDRQRAQTQGNGLTGKQKLAIVLGVVAIAAIVFFVVKYGKNCLRSEPAGCTPTVDEPCTCLEYEQNLRPAN
ncbi:MAG: hypothetical protein QM785_05815 [Pyrinomonadaceae bacterium]